MFITKEMASYIRCIFRNSTKSRHFFTHSENGVREYNHQLSKFNANEDNHESRISAAREIAIAVQSDPQICLNMPLLAERNKKQILYNVTGGRDWRFKICYHSYQQLAPKTMLTNEHMLRVALMGYLLEQVLSAYAVLDDIGDQAELRRNKKPWYKEDGKQVANDATILLHGAFVVLKLFFKDQPYYKRCSEILNEAAIWMLAQAQSLDMTLNDIFGSQKQYFTVDTHRKISSGKTRATCFYAPTILAMQMADYDYSGFHDQLMNIFTDLGIYLLVENDYCDRYGKTTGKALDEDIKNGKLTWMSLTAMQHANSEQKKIIMECYGKEDPRSTQAVVDIYEQLNLKEKVNAYKKELTENVQKNISQLPDPRVQNALTYSLKCIEMWYYA